MMQQLTDGVKHLILINVVLFIGTMLLMGDPTGNTMMGLINERIVDFSSWERYQLAIFYPSSPYFKPFQLVTHMFMHADIGHIFFNMFALYMFGISLERLWGTKRFIFFYFFSGFGALGLHMFVKYLEFQTGSVSPFTANVPMLGASGAVFGILAGFAMKFPNVKLMLLFPPIPMKAKYFVLIYAALELYLGINPFSTAGDSVAHFAHLGGALFGFLLILYWNKYGSNLN